MKNIIIASPHKRNSHICDHLTQRNKNWNIELVEKKSDLSIESLRKKNPEWIFFPHWSWIIPSDILNSFNCVIFHMTDLPFGRGGSPLQNLVLKGHKHTKISAIKCSEILDAGDIYIKRDLSLDGTAEEILSRASYIIQDMIIGIIENDPPAVPQEGDIIEFARRRPEQSDIGGLIESSKIFDHIRMLDADGYPNAFIESKNLKIFFRNAEQVGDKIEAEAIITIKDND